MPRWRLALSTIAAISLAALLLAGCSAKPATLELSLSDSGSTQQIAAGQQVRVSLEANPTTGYQWAVDGELPAQVEQVGAPEYKAGSTAIGAGGTEVWTFSGKEPGQGTVRLKYWRSFEPTVPPVKTFSATFDVK